MTRPSLARVAIRLIDLDAEPDADVETVLAPSERAAAARFVRPIDGRRYRAAHFALRMVLGQSGAGPPASLRFEHNARGKPRLAKSPIRFNLSHSGRWAAVAVSRDADVGVDIEGIRELDDLEGVARLVFHDDEIRNLLDLPAGRRGLAFFDCWTRREAYLKGLGLGVGDAKKLPPAWRPERPRLSPEPGWSVVGLDGPAGYALAAAAAADDMEVQAETGLRISDLSANPQRSR